MLEPVEGNFIPNGSRTQVLGDPLGKELHQPSGSLPSSILCGHWHLQPESQKLGPHTPAVIMSASPSKVTDNGVKENDRIRTNYNQILGLRDSPIVSELVFRSNISMD